MSDEFIIEELFFPACNFSNAMNAVADKEVTRDDMAEFYADCLRAGAEHGHDKIDWKALNLAIMKRWPKGLKYIKEKAWKKRRPPIRRAAEGEPRYETHQT